MAPTAKSRRRKALNIGFTRVPVERNRLPSHLLPGILEATQHRIGVMISPFMILVVLALLFAAMSIPWPNYPLLAVAVILLAVALLIGKGA